MTEKIAVITPYYKETIETLWKAHESVKNQGIDVMHIMVADGYPNDEVAKWDIQHAILPKSHGDNGKTPRGIGGILARAQNCNFIAYLDADNWFLSDHITSLISLHKSSGAPICASMRHFYTVEGCHLNGVSESDENNHEHIDTSCYLIHQSGFHCLSMWTEMPKQLSPLCDRLFLVGLRRKGLRIAHSNQRTVAFRSQYDVHYKSAGINPPPDLKANVGEAPMKWLLSVDGMRETVGRLGFFPL